MPWRRLGLVFCPNQLQSWMVSHASLPVPVHLEDDLFRIFFSTRDGEARSSIGYVDIDIRSPQCVKSISSEPVLSPGTAGMYDDSGCSLGSVVCCGGKSYLYYMGWNLGVTVPWRNSIGLAVGNFEIPDFKRIGVGPIMDRSLEDPFSLTYPWVMRTSDSSWHMWYGSSLTWGNDFTQIQHVIKYAISKNGIHWSRNDHVAVALSTTSEFAVTRPSVIYHDGRYRMWFASRGASYSLGYAESTDGMNWHRNDAAAGLEPAQMGWDSDMICYPAIFQHSGKIFMAYNGNGYGQTGFGLAVLDV